MVYHDNIYSSAKMFLIASLEKLNEISGGIVPKKREIIEFIENNNIGSKYQYKPFFTDIINDNLKLIKKLPETDNFIFELLNNNIIKKNIIDEIRSHGYKKELTEERLKEMCWGFCIYQFLLYYLEKTSKFEFDLKIFKNHFKIFINYFIEEKIKMKYLVPLYDLECQTDEIIVENCKIKKLSEKEKILLRKQFRDIFSIREIYDFLDVNSILFTEKDISKMNRIGGQDIKDMFGNILLALMLYKSGSFYSGGFYTKSLSEWDRTTSTLRSIFPKGIHFKKKYILNNDDKKKFPEFWERIKYIFIKEPRNLDIPLDRFTDSYFRDTIDDKIIDLMIALESLFLREDKELRYRLSLRIPFFLCDTYTERKNMQIFIKKAYDLRSTAVHGGVFPSKIRVNKIEYKLIDFVFELEDIVRKSIVKLCLDFSGSTIKLIDYIDNKILGN